MMITMRSSTSSRKDRDRTADKNSMDNKIAECTQTRARELMVPHNKRIQGDIKVRRRRNTEEEEIPTRGLSNTKTRYRRSQTQARVTWAMRMTWMKAPLWLKENR